MSVLDHAMLHAPIESLTQVTRNSQKVLAKDLTSMAAGVKALMAACAKDGGGVATAAGGGGASKSTPAATAQSKMQLARSLTSLIKDVQALKRKLEESERAAARQAKLTLARMHYLQQVEKVAQRNKGGQAEAEDREEEGEGEEQVDAPSASVSPPPRKARAPRNVRDSMDVDSEPGAAAAAAAAAAPASLSLSAAAKPAAAPTSSSPPELDAAAATSFSVTPQLRLDRMFAEHLLRNSQGSQDVFAVARRIESSLLEQHDCTRALAWCGENRSRLNKIGSPLEFDLRLQEFLTLVKQGAQMKAIEYARKHLAPAAITSAPVAPAPKPAGSVTPADDSAGHSRNNLAQGDEAKEKEGAAATEGAGAGATTMVADPARVRVLQEAMNLLVFYGFEQEEAEKNAASPTSTASGTVGSAPSAWHKYRVYWSPSRFLQLVDEFRRTHLQLYGLPRRSTLEYVHNIGLGSIKTSSCGCTHREEPRHGDMADSHTEQQQQQVDSDEDEGMGVSNGNGRAGSSASASSTGASSQMSSSAAGAPPACPACTYPLSCLAQSLPVAQRTQSRLVCRITGALMDDKNPPMVLPNGYVYSKRALQQMAADDADGKVTCPRTKQTFAFTQARIAYVL